VDDVVLGRNILKHGFRWQLVDGTQHVSCRMYRDFASARTGFTKNLFALFDYRLLLYLIGWSWICVCFLLPLVVLLFPPLGQITNFPPQLAVIAILEALLIFALAYRRSRFPMYLVLLYPLNMLMFVLLAIRSLIYTLLGFGTWKGRNLPPPAIRL
jgi:chlorobactene glucosyltransferase